MLENLIDGLYKHPIWEKNRQGDFMEFENIGDLLVEVENHYKEGSPSLMSESEIAFLNQFEAMVLLYSNRYHKRMEERTAYRSDHREHGSVFDPIELERKYPWINHANAVSELDLASLKAIARHLPTKQREQFEKIELSKDGTSGHVDTWLMRIDMIRKLTKRRVLLCTQ